MTTLRANPAPAIIAVAFLAPFFAAASAGAAPKVNLDQCRNGSAGSPAGCTGSAVNGNANATQAHYLEGHSVAYRAVMTGLPTGQKSR
jgi:hypothetical protein